MNKTRRSGLLLLCCGTFLFVLLAIAGTMLATRGWHLQGYGIGIPGAIALVGLVQLVSGVPFGKLATQWDSLKGWQRGILGTAIVIGAFLILAVIMLSIAAFLYG